jgi:hypothetical protein
MKLKFNKMADMFRTYRATNITDVNPTYTGSVKAIEVFWVSKSTGWCVSRMDLENNQFGSADFVYLKSEAIAMANDYARGGEALMDRIYF